MFGIVFAFVIVWYKILFGGFALQKKLLKSNNRLFSKKNKKTMTNYSELAITTFGRKITTKVRPPIRC